MSDDLLDLPLFAAAAGRLVIGPESPDISGVRNLIAFPLSRNKKLVGDVSARIRSVSHLGTVAIARSACRREIEVLRKLQVARGVRGSDLRSDIDEFMRCVAGWCFTTRSRTA